MLALLVQPGCGQQPEPEAPPVRRSQRIVRPAEALVPTESVSSPTPAPVGPSVAPDSGSAPDTKRGWSYKNERIRNGPWSVNLFKIDRSRSEFDLTTTSGSGRRIGLSTLSEQLEALPVDAGQPLAAVNGDFYRTEHDSYAGDPRGLQIMRGELISAPNGKTAFWIDKDGKPCVDDVTSRFAVTWPEGESTPLGLNEERESNDAVLYTPRAGPSTRARGGRELVLVRSGDSPWLPFRPGETYSAEVKAVRETGNTRLGPDTVVLSIGPSLLRRVSSVAPGAILKISMATSPDLRGVQTALGGGPVLVSGGKVQRPAVSKAYERHPRTAMGWNETHFFLVQVDGRQPGFSMGMTLPELAAYLVKQGCQEAMNLDGGGSSEMWVDGRVVNRPCFGYERNTANALVLVKKPALSGHAANATGGAAE